MNRQISIDEMIKWIGEYRKTTNDEETSTMLSMIGIFLAQLNDLYIKYESSR